MKTVIIGIDPGGRDGETVRNPLDPSFFSGARLARLIGIEPIDFLIRFDRINLHSSPGSRTEREDREAGINLLPILRGKRVIALGGRVAKAIGSPTEALSWRLVGGDGEPGYVGATIPHPSGLSRWWNSPDNTEKVREFLSKTLLPCVHVEGTDGSGKSSLVNEFPGIWSRIETEDPPSSWYECLLRIGRRLDPGTVCDRSSGLVSELVYGPVIRGKTVTNEEEIWRVVRSVSGAVTFVFCNPPMSMISPRFRKDEDRAHVEAVKNNKASLTERYREVFDRMIRDGCRVVEYDRTRRTPEEVI